MKNTFLLPLITSATGETLNVMDLMAQAGWVVKFVMFLLVLASVLSWTIIFWKWAMLRRASTRNEGFSDSFWAVGSIEKASGVSKSYTNAPLVAVYEAGLHEFNQIKSLKLKREEALELMETNLTRSLTKAANIETAGLHTYLSFLANTASTAPFIGLFGTVWGIMTAFINIGATGASNLAVVAPGIAEALIATALGLFAAIPAVLFYNYFVHGVKEVSAAMENFSSDFLNLAKRSI